MHTLSALYDNHDDARDVVSELEMAGVPADDLSIVTGNADGRFGDEPSSGAAEGAAEGAGLGAALGGATGLLTGLGFMAIPGLGPVVAAGWLATTAAGLAAGAAAGAATGGVIGALMASGVAAEDADIYAEGIRRGGTLVVARVSDDMVNKTREILNRPTFVDVAARRKSYEDEGWKGFDPRNG
ncbi:hypothetical protein [Aminobacter sp. MET-1]|uniref:hypothetical protein n=1 Tax=Aminobacter sp. MET-1 TaxID=2951085 RepID=UPI00226A2CA0|nr:hypothetical protein [Aminobacter sp. MET-1]MCX8570781.1 hypothetical protein [Aminobacter sp. MET-1]